MIQKLSKLFANFTNDNHENIIVQGDPIIQIGTVFHKYGDKQCYDKSIVIIGNNIENEDICDDIENINVYRCQNEKELLLRWKDVILFHNPDLITGYNIFGVDFDYLNKRIDHLFCNQNCYFNKYTGNKLHKINCEANQFYRLGSLKRNKFSDNISSLESVNEARITDTYYDKHWSKLCKDMSKELSSSGLGDNILKYISMDGRIVFDIQKEIQKNHSLDSYKIDNVSSHFMKGKIIDNKYFKVSFVEVKELNSND